MNRDRQTVAAHRHYIFTINITLISESSRQLHKFVVLRIFRVGLNKFHVCEPLIYECTDRRPGCPSLTTLESVNWPRRGTAGGDTHTHSIDFSQRRESRLRNESPRFYRSSLSVHLLAISSIWKFVV